MMHPYTVSTKALKVSAANASAADVAGLLQPDALQGFELQMPVNTFTSDKDGLTQADVQGDEADKQPMITFRLDSYTVEAAAGGATVKPLIHRVEPDYPAVAVAGKVSGTVILEATVNESGAEVHVLRSILLLDQAAIKTVKQWRSAARTERPARVHSGRHGDIFASLIVWRPNMLVRAGLRGSR